MLANYQIGLTVVSEEYTEVKRIGHPDSMCIELKYVKS